MQFLHTVHYIIFNNLTINIGIGIYFVYFHQYLKKNTTKRLVFTTSDTSQLKKLIIVKVLAM